MRETMVNTTMRQRSISDDWHASHRTHLPPKKRLRQNALFFSAVLLCAIGGAVFATQGGSSAVQSVMAHVTAGFEFDESIGRLHYVRNVLPESVMVFLTSSTEEQPIEAPSAGDACHVWTEQEPWIEYQSNGKTMFACKEGEVMSVIRNAPEKYTVRIRHENGYESVYSGLSSLHINEGDKVYSGEAVGVCNGVGAFELRHDGLSVLPVFK